uniref:Uncharacterized protein n=1 Tax=Tanacetum cinerariifolium TaxID=118510 RepID=A0A699HMR4_TANCI|nr:hypothetical protein [Tanacetum cinerariifolium]
MYRTPCPIKGVLRIQQYLQNEHYTLWEVIEFGDSYAPQDDAATGSASEGSAKKKGKTVAVTTEDIQKRMNDVKARTTLLLALPDEHQLRFSKLQAIVSHLEFIDVEIEHDDLNQKFLTSLAPEWLMYTIVWRNIAASISLDTACAYIASQSNGSQIKYEDINQIDEDDIKEMDIKWNMALLSMRADRFWKKTGKRSPYKECRAPNSQDRGKRENFKQGSKVEESAPKALMAIDGVGWDWSYMANEEENHALVADEEAPKKFALMAKSSSDSEVFDNSFCSKTCKKNTDSLNSKITELSEKLSDTKTNLYHYKLGLSQVEARLVEFKNQEIKFYEKIRGLKFKVESKTNRIGSLTNELEMLKKEKEGLDSKLTGYSVVPPYAQVYYPPKKDMSWTGLPEFVDYSITDYSKPSPSIESNSINLKNNSSSISENGESTSSILSKPEIKFVKATNCPTVIKASKDETVRNPSVKYAKMYRKTSKSSNNFPTVTKKFPTGNSKLSTADLGNKGKAVKASACWIWKPKQNSTDKGPNSNSVSVIFKKYQYIDTQGRLKSDSGCSRHMTGNISYLFDYEPYDEGTPRQHNMYSIDLNNVVPHKDLTCLVAKASADKSMLWHRRLGHLNFKTMNRLVRHNLVKGLPSKCFDNNHTCVAYLKGKQHKASCKTKLVNSVSKPLHTLHMDMFGPTSVSSLNHKWYCLVVTDDFSRVLVNKSQNKTPYELFNGRTPSIRFLKPFGCYVIILNTLDHLGKFEAKGDEGTKDAASQDVKKDVSSLRYIALLNWFHEAHLESSTSNAQDACKADATESSGNFNSTATSTNPLTNQMDTLTVETLIPNVSSPVPTACLNESLEPSSDTRLISKRFTSQDDTPSLDNILTLSNRFEDILRVTTNTGDTYGVEADLSNMENNISASPTHTLRIHKDHPISQIIGPVDTPVQTRTKSKEMEEQSFIATIHQMTNPDLLQFCLFSCFLSHEEPKKISDALKDPIYQMDVKSAFLYGTIDEEVYVMGIIDQTLFIQKHRGDFLLVQVYVDDIIFGSSNPQLCRDFEALMHEKFQMSAMGELNFFLGLQVLQKKDDIFLSQDKYVGDILKKFRYLDVRSSNTPMDKENPWGKDRTGKDVDLHLYRFMIGSLMYLTASRPDIMFAACACARHQVTPKECHMHAVKRIFRYLKGHPKLGLWYPKESPFDLVAYSDSDYGGATQDRKSTTGGCQFLGRRLISWQCKKADNYGHFNN